MTQSKQVTITKRAEDIAFLVQEHGREFSEAVAEIRSNTQLSNEEFEKAVRKAETFIERELVQESPTEMFDRMQEELG